MVSPRAKHEHYKACLQALGKDLARRSKSRCELSGARGGLSAVDLRGPDFEPELEHVVLVTPALEKMLQGGPLMLPLNYLVDAVWSSEPAVRGAAVRLLDRIDEPWARDAIENAHLMDATT